LRVAGPFGCRCPSIPPCPVSTPRSSNRACGFAAPGSPTGFSSWPTVPSGDRAFTGVDSCFCDRRTINGVARPCGQSPGSWSLPQRTRSEAPSLRRHYPASTVLWASPTPQAARPVPRGRPVGSRSHRLGSPVLRAFSLCRHAIATTPAGSSQGSGCSPDFDDGGLPQMTAGSAPASKPFRGLLGVHTCYGLPAHGVAYATLYIEGSGSVVTSTTAPIATGWSNSCQVGIAPTEERRLSRRTDMQVSLLHIVNVPDVPGRSQSGCADARFVSVRRVSLRGSILLQGPLTLGIPAVQR